jgi:hypothetical protein
MKQTQEPKYDAVAFSDSGRVGGGAPLTYRTALVNRHTGEAIPDDEPVMVFRARDIHARSVITHYLLLIQQGGCPQSHIDAVRARLADFENFALDHTSRMKVPD